MDPRTRDEQIGSLARHRAEDRKRLSAIDAELSDAVDLFKKAASQLGCLLAGERTDIGAVLSQLHLDRIVNRVAERERIGRRIAHASDQLRRLEESR